ncbi:hypothetical protein VIBNISFn118_960005 [Vibrio nigripulchritudo SFn118]|nr:hypothetical protein VIBNISFn118_960005 [Vibrio nigripulchritudo SFn118]
MKKTITISVLILFNLIVNYFIYYWSFEMQVGSIISDEQAFDIGMLMLKTTLPAFFVSSIFIVLLTEIILRKNKE